MSATDDDDLSDFGEELVYDSELDQTLQAAERGMSAVPDIEDTPPHALSPFEEFRRRGFLSVSDLVATVWCEVQFDYRLRTLPYLPVSRRPTTITSTKGTSIAVDQVKVEGKERILKRGETIHKRLEREIHPAEVKVTAVSREDAWGLRYAPHFTRPSADSRMLNMFSALEALLTLGKCRELPVAGFVDDVLVLGIIDEIVHEPIVPSPTKGRQTRSKRADSGRQSSLNDFFGGKPLPEPRTHRLLVSDSKTRASGSMPREEDTLAGRLQVMLYKELVDALLDPQEATVPSAKVSKSEGGSPEVVMMAADSSQADVQGSSSQVIEEYQSFHVVVHRDVAQLGPASPASPSQADMAPEAYLPTSSPSGSGLWRVWDYLGLDTHAPFSDEFVAQSRPVVEGNLLRFGVAEGRSLVDFAASWARYVAALGLGAGPGNGRTDDTLELVYRRAAPKRDKAAGKRKKSRKSKRRRRIQDDEGTTADAPSAPAIEGIDLGSIDVAQLDEETQLQLALQLSLQSASSQTGEEPAPAVLHRTEDSDAGRLLEGSGSQDPFHAPTPRAGETSSPPPTAAPPRSTPPQATVEVPPSPLKLPEESRRSHLELVSESASASGAESSGPTLRSQSTLGPGTHARSMPLSTQRSASSATKYFTSDSEQEREDAELAWAVEMSLGGVADEPHASGAGVMSPSKTRERPRKDSCESASGSIIGRHRFTHDRAALAAHLRSVLEYWRGAREPRGVDEANVRRCEWCEFEEGCEWREAKAQEALARYRNKGR